MAVSNERKLMTRGVFRSGSNKDYQCFLCITNDDTSDWDRHIASECHIVVLGKFRLIFVVNEEEKSILCRACDTAIDWCEIKEHAIWHRISPWHVFIDEDKIFFDNRITRFNSDYHCFPCKITVSDCEEALRHVSKEAHQNSVVNEPPVHETFKPTGTSYKYLVSEGFEPWGATTVKCRICNCPNVTLKSIVEHAVSQKHVEAKKNFRISLKVASASKDSSMVDTGKVHGAGRFGAGRDSNRFHNHACANGFRRYRSDDRSEKTQNQRSWSTKRSTDSGEGTKKILTPQNGENYPIQKKGDGRYCTICKKFVTTDSESHLNGEEHLSKLQEYGLDRMEQMANLSFRCNSCDCKVPNWDNVFRHIAGIKHRQLLSSVANRVAAGKENCRREQNVCGDLQKAKDCVEKEDSKKKEEADPAEEEGKRKTTSFRMDFSKSMENLHQNKPRFVARNANNYPSSNVPNFPQSFMMNVPQPLRMGFLPPMGPSAPQQMPMFFPMRIAPGMPAHNPYPRQTFIPGSRGSNVAPPKNSPKKSQEIARPIAMHELKLLFEADNCIIKVGKTDFCCKVCYILMSDQNLIEDHLQGGEHFEAAKLCGNRKIQEEGKYYCGLCRFVIPNFDDVMLHSISSSHREKAKKSPLQKLQILAREIIPKIEEIRNRGSNEIVNDSTIRLTPGEEFRKYKIGHIEILDNDEYKCKCCSSSILNYNDLIAHLADESHTRSAVKAERPNFSEDILETTEKTAPTPLNEPTELKHVSDEKTKESEFQEHLLKLLAAKDSANRTHDSPQTPKAEESFDEPPQCTDPPDGAEIKGVPAFPGRSNESCSSVQSSITKLRSVMSSAGGSEYGRSERKRRLPTTMVVSNEKNGTKLDRDTIYSMKEKWQEIEKSIELSMMVGSDLVFCLSCENAMANSTDVCYEHFRNPVHIDAIEQMEKDHALFISAPEQLSQLDLAREYMLEFPGNLIHCKVCDVEINNVDRLLKTHMSLDQHAEKCRDMKLRTKENFRNMESAIRCNWYNIFSFTCDVCSFNANTEREFFDHLEGSEHHEILKKPDNHGTLFLHDFCSPCAILWYGPRKSYAEHRLLSSHESRMRNEDYVSPKLPTSAKCLLSMWEMYIQDSVGYLDGKSVEDQLNVETLIRDLEGTAKTIFADSKAHACGMRFAGLVSQDVDMEIFIDCGKNHDENDPNSVPPAIIEALERNDKWWNTEEICMKNRVSRVTTRHRATGIQCEIFFDRKIDVDNWNLIRSVNDKFTSSRNLIIFLTQWLKFCCLYGPEKIPSTALCWLVIFCLQHEKLIPKFVEKNEKSNSLIASKIVLPDECTESRSSDPGIKQYLIKFFTFYANFDFRYDVACPLIGKQVKKCDFENPENLTIEMSGYMEFLKNSNNSKGLPVDSPMCLQNPVSLDDNLTANVSKIHLNRFRTYCFESLNVLDTPLAKN